MTEPDGPALGPRPSALGSPQGRVPRAEGPLFRATILVMLAAAGFGSIAVLMSVALQDGATVASALVFRFLIAAPLFLAAAGWRAATAVGGRQLAELLVLGGGGQAAVTLISLSALHYVPAATLGFLFYTYPAWIAVFAALRGTERVTPPRALALALSLGGIATIIGNPWAGELHPTGVLLALGSAVVYALYVPLLGWLQRGISASTTSMYVAIGAVVFCGAWGLLAGELTASFGSRGWLAVAALAVLSTFVAFNFFLRGLAVLGPVRTGIVSTVEPFWTALLAAAALGQALSVRTFVGGAMIAAAVLLLQLRRGER